MPKKFDLHALFSPAKKSSVQKGSVFGNNPYRDWQIVVALTVLLVCGVAAGGYYLFDKISRGEIFLSEKTNATVTNQFDRQELDRLVKLFEARDKKFKDLQENAPAVIDPSL